MLEAPDWYFNRAIVNIMVAIGDELDKGSTNSRFLAQFSAQEGADRAEADWGRSADISAARPGPISELTGYDVHAFADTEWTHIYRGLLKLTRCNEAVYVRFLKSWIKVEMAASHSRWRGCRRSHCIASRRDEKERREIITFLLVSL
jgi:hypothetical protein